MAKKNRVTPLFLTSVDARDIDTDTWTSFSSAGTEAPCFKFTIFNDTSSNVFISFNGEDEHMFLAYGDRFTIDLQEYASPNGKVSQLKKGTVIYISGNPSQNEEYVYLSGYYN